MCGGGGLAARQQVARAAVVWRQARFDSVSSFGESFVCCMSPIDRAYLVSDTLGQLSTQVTQDARGEMNCAWQFM